MPHSGFTEYVEPYEGLPNDDCGDASGRPAIHEGESPGENGNAREPRAGCPGTAASSTTRSMSWVGPSATAEVAELWFSEITARQS